MNLEKLDALNQLSAASLLYLCSSPEAICRFLSEDPQIRLRTEVLKRDSDRATDLAHECLMAIQFPADQRIRNVWEAPLIIAVYVLFRAFPGYFDEIANRLAIEGGRDMKLVRDVTSVLAAGAKPIGLTIPSLSVRPVLLAGPFEPTTGKVGLRPASPKGSNFTFKIDEQVN